MAEPQEERSREDLSEEASPYRIEEFRRKGIVPQSRELTGVLAFIATVVAVYTVIPTGGQDLMAFMKEVFSTNLSQRTDLDSIEILKNHFVKALKVFAMIGVPIALAGFVVSILGSFMQVGSVFSTEQIQPDLSRINPLQGIKRFFSMRILVEGLRLIFKSTVIVVTSVFLVKAEIFKNVLNFEQTPAQQLLKMGQTSTVIVASLFGILLVFSGIDYFFQRREWSIKVRLTKAEAKQEVKEREGDPQIKARIRAVQREVARRRMMAAVKKADVVITNPTHIAVAIKYDKNNMAAPRVLAKGADYIAQQIKKVALEAGIPMVENVPLARALFKSVKINQIIPKNLYQAVAEVLAYVYRLKGFKG